MRTRPQGSPKGAKGAVKAKVKEKAKAEGVGSGTRLANPRIRPRPKAFAICMRVMPDAKNDNCPYPHLSQDQVKRALGQGGSDQRDASRGSNDAAKDSRGRGKGRGTGRKGKKDDQSRSKGPKDKDAKSVPLEVEIQQLRSKPRWCPQNLKGACQKGDMCPYPHLDADALSNIKSAEKRQKDMQNDGGKGADRGRSPSRDKKGKKGRKCSIGSE